MQAKTTKKLLKYSCDITH